MRDRVLENTFLEFNILITCHMPLLRRISINTFPRYFSFLMRLKLFMSRNWPFKKELDLKGTVQFCSPKNDLSAKKEISPYVKSRTNGFNLDYNVCSVLCSVVASVLV